MIFSIICVTATFYRGPSNEQLDFTCIFCAEHSNRTVFSKFCFFLFILCRSTCTKHLRISRYCGTTFKCPVKLKGGVDFMRWVVLGSIPGDKGHVEVMYLGHSGCSLGCPFSALDWCQMCLLLIIKTLFKLMISILYFNFFSVFRVAKKWM